MKRVAEKSRSQKENGINVYLVPVMVICDHEGNIQGWQFNNGPIEGTYQKTPISH